MVSDPRDVIGGLEGETTSLIGVIIRVISGVLTY
jgi:hypothetical protein